MSLVVFTDLGFYCPQADVYIDPLRKVSRAIVPHAHSDHARPGMGHYLCESSGHLAYVLSLLDCFRYYVFELTTRNPNNDFFI